MNNYKIDTKCVQSGYTFWFDYNAISSHIYKNIIHNVFDKANLVFFKFYEDLMDDDRVLQLRDTCNIANIPRELRDADKDVVGYETDIFVKRFFYKYSSFYELLNNLVFGEIFFFYEKEEIIAIQLSDFDEIYIKTKDKDMINILSDVEEKWPFLEM